jgi:TetR/AcrR family transcriptional repressor of nem operon
MLEHLVNQDYLFKHGNGDILNRDQEARMVAVRQFDEDAALEQIMRAFWTEGYQATSIDDIVAATGLKRGSLYAAFGDKKGMFLKAYARYARTVESRVLAALERPAVRDAVAGVFDRSINDLFSGDIPPGCMIAQTMAEAPFVGADIEALAGDSFRRSEDAFYARLLQGQADGEIAPGADLRAMARFFAATLRSVATVYRLTRDRGVARDIAATALARLD